MAKPDSAPAAPAQQPAAQRRAKPPATPAGPQTSGASPAVTLDGPPAVKLPSKANEDTPNRTSASGAEPWVLDIIGDMDVSDVTRLRAAAIQARIAQTGPVSEEEFLASRAADPVETVPSTPGISSDEAGKMLTDHIRQQEKIIRDRAIEKASSLLGADWHAKEGSEARKKADSLHKGDPQKVREEAMKAGILWAMDNKEKIQAIQAEAERKYKEKKSPKARETAEAASELLTAIGAAGNVSIDEMNYTPNNPYLTEDAWKYLGSEKTKKYLEKVGAPIPWFTTCVTMVDPVAKAVGVDTSKWGALDMFHKKDRFNSSIAWVPASWKQRPKPGDILIFVSYLTTYSQDEKKNVMRKELGTAVFQHVSVLYEEVTDNGDGTEKWVTADGGKGSSHQGQDLTGLTTRRYNPLIQQFVPDKYTNLQEAAFGGRYLLGFWDLTRLPMLKPEDQNKAKQKKK